MRVSGPVLEHNYARITQSAFGGLNRRTGAANGEIIEMKNMSGDNYPVLSTRPQGWRREGANEEFGDIYAFDIFDGKIAWIVRVNTTAFLYYGRALAVPLPLGTTAGERQMVQIGTLICIWPDKWFCDVRAATAGDYTDTLISSVPQNEWTEGNVVYAGEFVDDAFTNGFYIYKDGDWQKFSPDGPMEAYIRPTNAVFCDGTFAGQPAERNTIRFSKSYAEAWTENWRLNVGNAVEISGALNAENNKIAIIREIDTDDDYMYLRFYEGTFVNNASDDDITIKRKAPELEHVCQHKNRLWGCKGKEIFCSHLGDPLNWYEYDSLADGAWAVETGGGDLTGCFSYNYPLFFTENEIYTVLGDSPSEFALSVTPNTYGCAKGSHKSFAVVDRYLFYHSPYGFCYYYGSMPYLCSEALGKDYYFNAVGGGKGGKYYVSCEDADGIPHTFVFSTDHAIWHEETNAWSEKVEGYAWDGDLYCIMGDGVYTVGKPRSIDSGKREYTIMPSEVLFAPWDRGSVNRKQLKSICIRHEVQGELTVKLFADGVENESLRKTVRGSGMTEIVGIPKRGDRWQLKLEGRGEWKVYSIAYDFYEGSVKK